MHRRIVSVQLCSPYAYADEDTCCITEREDIWIVKGRDEYMYIWCGRLLKYVWFPIEFFLLFFFSAIVEGIYLILLVLHHPGH